MKTAVHCINLAVQGYTSSILTPQPTSNAPQILWQPQTPHTYSKGIFSQCSTFKLYSVLTEVVLVHWFTVGTISHTGDILQRWKFYFNSLISTTIIWCLFSTFRSPFTNLQMTFTPANEQNSSKCSISYEHASMLPTFLIIFFLSPFVCNALLTNAFIHIHITKFGSETFSKYNLICIITL